MVRIHHFGCSVDVWRSRATKKGHLSDWAHFVTLGLLILSESVLFGDDPYTPWSLFIYAVVTSFLMMMDAERTSDKDKAFEASSATAATMGILCNYFFQRSAD